MPGLYFEFFFKIHTVQEGHKGVTVSLSQPTTLNCRTLDNSEGQPVLPAASGSKKLLLKLLKRFPVGTTSGSEILKERY